MTNTNSVGFYREIRLFTHAMSPEQRAQLDRAVGHFHDAQRAIRLRPGGERSLTEHSGRVDFRELLTNVSLEIPEITATGMSLVDNWFTHTRIDRALLTVCEWQVAFGEDRSLPPFAPDAHILASLALICFLLCCRARDHEALHSSTTGCISDLCQYKPERVMKMRAAYICAACKARAGAAGVSAIELDAMQAILDRVRLLTIGRIPQAAVPASELDDDAAFVRDATLPAGVKFPAPLQEAFRARKLSVCIGSGLSLQSDVIVKYHAPLEWKRLPTWSEISSRLALLLNRYRARDQAPRGAESLDEYLADLDFYRTALGERAYYPQAIFDLFCPEIQSAGRANRLIFRLPLPWVLTTNYDLILNVAAPPGTPVYTWRESRQAREYLRLTRNHRPPLLKIHGCASRPDTVVLTRSEYQTMRQWDEYRSLMTFVFDVQSILFIGFGFSDPFDLDLALEQSQLAGAAQGEKFALIPASNVATIRERCPNVHVIGYERYEDLASILAVLYRESVA